MESVKAATSQMTLEKAQLKAIFAAKGLSGAELDAAVATVTSSVAQKEAAATTGGLTAAMKGLGVAIATNPLFWAAGAAIGIYATVKAIDYFTVSVEEARDAAIDSASELDELESSINSINSELKTSASRIDELNDKPNLTFIEQEELQNLKDTTAELERQLELKDAMQNVAEANARDSAIEYLDKKGSYQRYAGWDMSQVEAGNAHYGAPILDIFTGNQLDIIQQQLSDYESYINRKNELDKKIVDFKISKPNPEDYTLADKDALANMEQEATTLDNSIESLKDTLTSAVGDLTTYKENLDSSQDSSYIDYINSLQDAYSNIFGGGKDASKAFDDIWNADTFSNARKELESMAQAGTLSPATLTNNETYNQLLKETGKTAEETCENIYALVEAEKSVTTNSPKIFDLSSFSNTIDRLSKITSLYDEFKGKIKDKAAITFDISDVDDLRSSLLKTDKQLGISEEQFNTFESVLSSSESTVDDIQKAFDTLSSQFIYQSGCLDGLNTSNRDLIVSQLELQGITNASSIVTEELAQASEILAASGYSLTDATNTAYWALLDESGASEATKASLYQLNAAEIAYNGTGLNVQDKISSLGSLASAYGDTASAAIAAAAADRVANGHGTYESVMEDLIAQMNRATSNITIQAPKISGSPSKKSGSGGSKSKDTSEEINYIDRLLSQSEKRIQQYKNELEDAFTLKDKYTALDKIVAETESQLKTMDDVYKFYSDKASEKLAQIPEGMRDAVKDGTIDIETLNDGKLANLIKEFWDLDGEADDAKDKIRDLDKSIKDLAKQRVQIKIDVLENKQDRLNFKLDKYKALISAVVSGIEGEIDDVNDYYDRKIDKIQSQIDALETQKKVYQYQLDALNEQNEALEIQKKLEDALYEKRKAENNKNVHIYREYKGDGKSGFVWESDQDAVKDANEQYDEAVFDKKKYDLQTQIDAFDKQISALDETIDKLEKSRDNELDYLNSIKDSWSSIEETAERIASMEMADGFWGDSWFSDIMNGDTSYLDDMTEKFQTTYGIISDNQQEIDRLNELLSTIDGVDNATAMHLANMATGFNTLGTTATTQSGNVNTATTSIPPLTEENRALNEESLLLWGENFTTFGGQACGVADSIAVSYESMAARLEAAAERAVRAIKRIKRAERDDDDDEGYAKGTRNAKPGLHPVAEGNKPEIIIKNSGSAVIADKETYYPFSGGETVLKPQDTKDILSGDNTSPTRLFNGIDMDFLNSFEPQEMTAKYLPNINLSRFDESKVITQNMETKNEFNFNGGIQITEAKNVTDIAKGIVRGHLDQALGQVMSKI